MTHQSLILAMGLPLLMAVVGLTCGLVYFAALHRTATLLARQGPRAPLLLAFGRIGVVVPFAIAAKLGATPLFAALAGFLLARAVALHVVRGGG